MKDAAMFAVVTIAVALIVIALAPLAIKIGLSLI